MTRRFLRFLQSSVGTNNKCDSSDSTPRTGSFIHLRRLQSKVNSAQVDLSVVMYQTHSYRSRWYLRKGRQPTRTDGRLTSETNLALSVVMYQFLIYQSRRQHRKGVTWACERLRLIQSSSISLVSGSTRLGSTRVERRYRISDIVTWRLVNGNKYRIRIIKATERTWKGNRQI